MNLSISKICLYFSKEKSSHSITFKESKMNELITAESSSHLDLITLTQQQLVRVYPGTLRQNSSNLHPLFYWTYGKRNRKSFFLNAKNLFRSSNGCT
jgi:hypothetical protein